MFPLQFPLFPLLRHVSWSPIKVRERRSYIPKNKLWKNGQIKYRYVGLALRFTAAELKTSGSAGDFMIVVKTSNA